MIIVDGPPGQRVQQAILPIPGGGTMNRFTIDGSGLLYTGEDAQNAQEAKEISIKKYEFIIQHLGNGNNLKDDGGTQTCGFCQLYWYGYGPDTRCQDCPVKLETGAPHCIATPYWRFRNCLLNQDPDALYHAIQEKEFLNSLKVGE